MITKKILKDEINKMPVELVKPVYQYIKKEEEKISMPKIPTIKLGGIMDDEHIREKAYE